MKDALPVYRVEPQSSGPERLPALGDAVFGLKDEFSLEERRDCAALRNGSRVVEVARASGGVWAADESKLWKPTRQVDLPSEEEALKLAEAFVQRSNALPKLRSPLRFGRPTIGGTHFALKQDGRRTNRKLDVSVTFPLLLDELPVIGGGSGVKVTVGHQGEIIAFSSGIRSVTSGFHVKLIDRARAMEQLRAATSKLDMESMDLSLAYYAAPAFAGQEFLYPVYVGRGVARIGKQRVPLRQMLLGATEFGPPLTFAEPQPKRTKMERPPTRFAQEMATRRTLARRTRANPFEVGTSWIGESGGLAGSQANAQGFIDEWAADGWLVNFNWGDANAWESDWRRNDDTWVDNADFVFYTGHANQNGWVLSNPDDGFLSFTEVGGGPASPGDLWGQNDLEWAVIAACGPLQDELLAEGGGDVFARWDGAFDGLHTLLGYGAVTFDNTDEGRRLAQHAKSGRTVIDSWFRTAREIQPATNGVAAPDGPDVWVGAMWVGKPGADPFNDHAWGHGSVSADPKSPTWMAAMWTTC